jgi:hypothetical protein
MSGSSDDFLAMVSRAAIPRPGDGVRVKLDPDMPQEVIVV